MSIKMLCRTLHAKCRDSTKPYLRSRVYRIPVKDDQVPWDSGECSYSPKDYTAKTVYGKTWADHEDPCIYTFNQEDDDGINRLSFNGVYSLDSTGRPLNPFGRTGLRGRGVLGKWGPNHAADAIVSRYVIGENGRQILQFVAIVRNDTEDLAIPGGMIDPGEDAREAAIREFHEEALSNNVLDEKLSSIWKNGRLYFSTWVPELIYKLTPNGKTVYQGYVDDPRNTDNSWMETSCFNFHDTTENLLKDLNLKAGSDAKFAKWITVENGLKLYASHTYLVKLFAKMHDIHID